MGGQNAAEISSKIKINDIIFKISLFILKVWLWIAAAIVIVGIVSALLHCGHFRVR